MEIIRVTINSCKKTFVVQNVRGLLYCWKLINIKIFIINYYNYSQISHTWLKENEGWERVCCVRGYHIYKHIWEAVECQREPCNIKDRYAVAVIKDEIIIGHLPRKVSRVSSLFLRRGGSIQSIIVGRRYSSDLPQGGLEILCCLIFTAMPKEMQRLKKTFKFDT